MSLSLIFPFGLLLFIKTKCTAAPHTNTHTHAHRATPPSSQYFISRLGASCGVSAGPALYTVCTSETGWANAWLQLNTVDKSQSYRVFSPADTVLILQYESWAASAGHRQREQDRLEVRRKRTADVDSVAGRCVLWGMWRCCWRPRLLKHYFWSDNMDRIRIKSKMQPACFSKTRKIKVKKIKGHLTGKG